MGWKDYLIYNAMFDDVFRKYQAAVLLGQRPARTDPQHDEFSVMLQ